jgi:DNA-directed RNA polymerase subunit RPC12/RpoP
MSVVEIAKESRAVLRQIEPGNSQIECAGCGDRIIFRARARANVVICNVYVAGVWQNVEQFHAACYDGRHGEPKTKEQ